MAPGAFFSVPCRYPGLSIRQGAGRPLSSPPTMKFDPEHLRIAAEVRAKARRRTRFEQVGGMLALLIMAVSLVWVSVLLVRIAYLVL